MKNPATKWDRLPRYVLFVICLAGYIWLSASQWNDRKEHAFVDMTRLAPDGTLQGGVGSSKKSVEKLILCIVPPDHWPEFMYQNTEEIETPLSWDGSQVLMDGEGCKTLKSMDFPPDHFWFFRVSLGSYKRRIADAGPEALVTLDTLGYRFQGIELDSRAVESVKFGVAMVAIVHSDGVVRGSKVFVSQN